MRNIVRRVASTIRTLPLFISKRISRRTVNKFLSREIARITPGSIVLSVGAGGEIGRAVRLRAQRYEFTIVELDCDQMREPDILADVCSYCSDEAFDAFFFSSF